MPQAVPIIQAVAAVVGAVAAVKSATASSPDAPGLPPSPDSAANPGSPPVLAEKGANPSDVIAAEQARVRDIQRQSAAASTAPAGNAGTRKVRSLLGD